MFRSIELRKFQEHYCFMARPEELRKPIQISVTHTRSKYEQQGQLYLHVLTADGRIFYRDQMSAGPQGKWEEVKGPWSV